MVEQGWRSGESARLPPMLPGLNSGSRRHKWTEFVDSPNYPTQGSAVDNFRSITCLPLMWKLFSEKIYNHFEREQLLPEEQKGYRKGARRTKDKLLIDKMILHTNLATALIDFCKAYDIVLHSWIMECICYDRTKYTRYAPRKYALVEDCPGS